MKKFLELVAEDIYNKYKDRMEDVVIVFPNKRASLFFKEYLAKQTDKPMWSPRFTSINDLMSNWSELQLGDPILLICELYKVFIEETNRVDESLDMFYHWGQILISDFDDIDKNLVRANDLFRNLKDLKMYDNIDYLTDEEKKAIEQFFGNVTDDNKSKIKKNFLNMWSHLGNIYNNYKNILREKGLAYEGMMFRDIIEKGIPLDDDKVYAFVGFNVLNKVEQKLFDTLKDANKSVFYWDYDEYYTHKPGVASIPYHNEAGEFINRNLKKYPNELGKECFRNMEEPKNVEYISSPTEEGQVKYIDTWLRKYKNDENEDKKEKDYAIILCNEEILLPTIYSIPSFAKDRTWGVKNINITMGFPLSQTPIFSLAKLIIELEKQGYNKRNNRYRYEYIMPILKHPYIVELTEKANSIEKRIKENNKFYPEDKEWAESETLRRIFKLSEKPEDFYEKMDYVIERCATLYKDDKGKIENSAQLYKESIFKMYTVINRMNNMLLEGNLNGLEMHTHFRLLLSILMSTNIPFHGEPIMGMQVMGVLETRNLDFENLIMLSLNEGKLPQKISEASFVPYNLRKAFDMTTPEHKNAVYAYYFYRLLQRAKNVTLMYNSSSEGMNQGEMSRFMMQYMIESSQDIKKYYLSSSQELPENNTIKIKKTEEMIEKLIERYSSANGFLSPSGINMYKNCPMKFFFSKVARLHTSSEVNDQIEMNIFGNIFHKAAEMFYKMLKEKNNIITSELLKTFLEKKNDYILRGIVKKAFQDEFFNGETVKDEEYNGTQLISFEVIMRYFKRLIKLDSQIEQFEILGLEKHVENKFTLNIDGKEREIKIGGTIDRIDRVNGKIRIVDYKTSGEAKAVKDMGKLFTIADKKETAFNYAFQAFLYANIIRKSTNEDIQPALLYVNKAGKEGYSPIISYEGTEIENFDEVMSKEYETELRDLLENNLFNKDVDFIQTSDDNLCTYCDFKRLCGKVTD